MRSLVFAALLLIPGLAAAGPRALLDHALRTTRDASATFKQTRTDALGETVTDGTLAYRKPRKLRLEWRGKAGATAFVNRDTLWFYQPGQKSVLKSRASAGGAPPALFLEESVDVLDKAYRVKEEGATGLVLENRGVAITREELVQKTAFLAAKKKIPPQQYQEFLDAVREAAENRQFYR